MGKSYRRDSKNDNWRRKKQEKWQKKDHRKPFFVEDPKNGFPMADTPTYDA